MKTLPSNLRALRDLGLLAAASLAAASIWASNFDEPGVMLDAARDEARATCLARPGHALDCQVDRLGAASGEDDLARLSVERRGESLAGLVERRSGRPAIAVNRRRVAELLAEQWQHRIESLAAQRRRRGMVQVDRHSAEL